MFDNIEYIVVENVIIKLVLLKEQHIMQVSKVQNKRLAQFVNTSSLKVHTI